MMELPQQTKDKTPSKTQNLFSLSSLSSSVMEAYAKTSNLEEIINEPTSY